MSNPVIEITPSDEAMSLIFLLRSEGWAVILWTPDELEGVDPDIVETSSIEHGWKIIEMNKETHAGSLFTSFKTP